ESDIELYQKHLSQAPVPPSRRTANPISAEMQETLLRCLEKEPNMRPHSVQELRELLLTSPAACQWRMEDRMTWWGRFHAGQPGGPPQPEESEGRSDKPTVRIHFAEG